MKVKIVCDTSCDLTKELILKNDIEVVPFTVILGDKEFKDGVNITPNDIIDFCENNDIFPKTSAINQMDFEEAFKKHLDGDTEIVYMGISSELSASYNNAKLAAEELENVHIINGLSLSTGTGLLVLKACEYAREGLSAKEIVEKITKLIPKVQASFIVEKIDYLRKGGRCSMLAAFGANLFKIKPTLILKEGKIVPDRKFVGKTEICLKKYVEYILEKFPNANKERVFITHTPVEEGQVELVSNLLKEAGFKEILETSAGGTITCHCGPGTLGILYLCN